MNEVIMDQTGAVQWADWWASVPPYFAFLVGLPFAIAALVFVVDAIRKRVDERSDRTSI